MERWRLSRRILPALAVLTIAISPLSAQSGPQLPDPGRTMSRDQQEKLGLQAASEVYRQMPVLPDSSPVTQYVQQLGRKLQEVIPADRSWPYQFHVIPQKEINAFALPGGPIFINLGTIQAAADEGQLAGVMSHEMAHVYMQHSAKRISKQQWTGLLAGIAGAVTGNSAAGMLARAGIQFGAGTVLLHYSRKDESQADAVGAIIMYEAGFNPIDLAEFFSALEKQSGNGGPQFLNSHPNPGNRETAIQQQIRDWPKKQFLSSDVAFKRAQEEAKGIKTYTAEEIAQGAKQGIWQQQNQRNGAGMAGSATQGGAELSNVSFEQVQPSNRFVESRQSDFTIEHPENWKASSNGGSLQIAPAAGAGPSGVAYGVIIGAAPNATGSLDDATKQVIDSLLKDNPGMQVAGEINSLTVAGQQGRSVYLSGRSPIRRNGQALGERDWLVTVARPQGGVLFMVFVAPEDEFNRLQSVYSRMVDSLALR
jgi:predicted Zn-dependent protease